jgi:hypothetical protein
MKSIAIGFGMFAVAAAFGSAAGQSPPFVTLEWRVEARFDFCSGCAEGCVRPGGLCIRSQSFRIATDGTVQNLGTCPVPAAGLGALEVSSHLVTCSGPFVDMNALGVCSADCCWNNDCLCYLGPLEPGGFVMTFSRPVWFGWGNGQTESNGMTTAPETSTTLFGTLWSIYVQYTAERADFDADGFVDGADLGRLLDAWMVCVGGNCAWAGRMDLNDSGQVDGADLGLLLARWGQVP